MKKMKILLTAAMACILCLPGCSQSEEKTDGKDIPEEYQFVETNVGKSSEEVKALIGKDWEDRSEPGTEVTRYQDADGNQYMFYDDRLAAVQYAYEDPEQGFLTCRSIYDYISDAVGEEAKDHVLPGDKTLKDITTLEEFQALGGEESTYDAASNWYLTSGVSDWECISDSAAMQTIWEDSGEQPILTLNLWMADQQLSVAIGYSGVPNL